MSTDREPYAPTNAEWEGLFNNLCMHCDRLGRCDVIEGMIEMKDGGEWPQGGWVTDPGAAVTCLSYEPKPRLPLSRQRLRQAMRKSVPMCDGCAARKGSDASRSLHTQRDFAESVRSRAQFNCHAAGNEGKPCGGWCQAVKRQTRRSTNEP
ncbi:hypothetical protein GY26_16255 [Gammaproteobacteria bacterium MFB021]|nr:hypothetical protein GY26_16255 [Gammaproteobacteria bacterium MFB021]